MASIKVLVFKTAESHFALLSNAVKEIVETKKTLKNVFYDKGGALKGLVNYENDMISVINTDWVFDFDKENENNENNEEFILVCKEREMDRAVAITANIIVGMESIDTSKIKGTQDLEKGYSFGFLREGTGRNERIVTFLDLQKFLEFSKNKIEKLQSSGTISY